MSDGNAPERKRLRLAQYDYSTPGAYFVTICCADMKCLFGAVQNGKVILSHMGAVADRELFSIEEHHNVAVDTHMIMPNHVHAVLFLNPAQFSESLREPGRRPAAPTGGADKVSRLGTIVNAYKRVVTIAVRGLTGDKQYVVWQRGYHEHIIRDEEDLNIRRQYILDNPQRWTLKNSRR